MNKRGVSLVTLVLTIIILVILTGVIIVSINNNAVIGEANKATMKQNQVQAQQVASLAFAEKVMDGIEDEAIIKSYVEASLVANGYKLSDYKITVDSDGVKVVAYENLIYDSNGNVTELVDGVPIPKGFVASSVAGENTKAGGLVIYEGDTAVTSENHATALTTRNQYVWVPVEDFSEFVRDDFNETGISLSNTPGTGVWELEIGSDNKPKNTQDPDYISEATRKEAIAMYDSVEKYGGFYIARYEVGMNTLRTDKDQTFNTGDINFSSYSVAGKMPCINIKNKSGFNEGTSSGNGYALTYARSIYPSTSDTTGVVSTLVYGVQYDTTYRWLKETGAISSYAYNATKGNVLNTSFSAGALTSGSKYSIYSNKAFGTVKSASSFAKTSGQSVLLSTGAYGKLNNIYELGGNIREWSMEGSLNDAGSERFVQRGLAFLSETGMITGRTREGTKSTANAVCGFRTALYIK